MAKLRKLLIGHHFPTLVFGDVTLCLGATILGFIFGYRPPKAVSG